MNNNRQLRSWVFMLYPDNPNHKQAVNYLDLLTNSLYIRHIAKYDEEGNQLNKEHYHCVLKYENPMWLSSILKELGLSEEDSHLFHSYSDFKIGKKNRFKSLNDYIDYLDHQKQDDKPDKYSPDDFKGGLKSLALQIINDRDKEKYVLLAELCDFIRTYNLNHFNDTRTFTFTDWFKVCCDHGYGVLFYREWYKMRDILKAYILS